MREVRPLVRMAVVLCALVGGFASSAQAAPLELHQAFPDITASFIETTYNPITTESLATGFPSSYLQTSNPASEVPVLAGSLFRIGFTGASIASSTVLEFLVTVNGGLGVFGPQAGMILSQVNFTAALDSGSLYSTGTIADNFAAVPEPSTLALLGLGLTAYRASRRRKKQ